MPDGTGVARTLRTARELVGAGLIAAGREAAIGKVAEKYAVAIPPALAALIGDAEDPIGRQFVPDEAELTTVAGESADPIADEALSPIKGIVHRYPDRVLLKPILACPVYCRFCFRREQVGPDGGVLGTHDLAHLYAWLKARPAIREVILTGGDPLLLSPRRLGAIVSELSQIPHIETLRVHTRVPIATPERITKALTSALSAGLPMWVVTHANHAREITEAARAAVGRMLASGIPVLGQSVLLAGVNDSEEALEALFRAMIVARIKPYYLHQLDRAPGTARFHVPIARGRALLAGLRGRIPGHALPTYIVERPGGQGKVPIALPPPWAAARSPRMKQQANQIRAGQVIEHEGRRWSVLKQQIITPGKGGAFIQVEMRDLKSGNKTNERWRTADTVERLLTDEKEFTYSYSDGANLVLMDNDTFEQTMVPVALLGDAAAFLQDNMHVTVDLVEGEPVAVHLPQTAVLEVVEADPVVRGQTAASSYKPARLSNGVKTMVPPFVETGEKIVVRTEDATYVERAKA